MNKQKFNILALLIIVFSQTVQPLHACSCVPQESLQLALSEADAVFVGKVTRIQAKYNYFQRLFYEMFPQSSCDLFEIYQVEVELSVSEFFKGGKDIKLVSIVTSDY